VLDQFSVIYALLRRVLVGGACLRLSTRRLDCCIKSKLLPPRHRPAPLRRRWPSLLVRIRPPRRQAVLGFVPLENPTLSTHKNSVKAEGLWKAAKCIKVRLGAVKRLYIFGLFILTAEKAAAQHLARELENPIEWPTTSLRAQAAYYTADAAKAVKTTMATYPVELAPGASKEGKVCVAVGGGGGFIGSWLALDLKKKGFYVICADWKRNEFMEVPEFCDEFHLADLRIPANCLRVCDGCRDVYNLAADMGGMGFIKSNESVLMYNNTMISFNMLEAARCKVFTRVYLFLPPRHRADAVTGATSRRWRRAVYEASARLPRRDAIDAEGRRPTPSMPSTPSKPLTYRNSRRASSATSTRRARASTTTTYN
jgi:hypothetical protein